jgi:hypothetical protein
MSSVVLHSRSRYERLEEQRRQHGLRLHGVGPEFRSKEKRNERTGSGAHEDHETGGRVRDSRTDASHKGRDGEFMHSRGSCRATVVSIEHKEGTAIPSRATLPSAHAHTIFSFRPHLAVKEKCKCEWGVDRMNGCGGARSSAPGISRAAGRDPR